MKSVDRLVSAFRRFPGVGPKQAERLSIYVLRASNSEVEELVLALRAVKSSIKVCRQCYNYTEQDICAICSDKSRDASILCVVEDPQDVAAVEKTRSFNGFYHVLGGPISPMDGASADSVRLNELITRIKNSNGLVREVIIATDPDTEGESTALYLAGMLKSIVPKVTRIAYGMPLGGDLDYTDEMTLGCALKGRTEI